MPNIRGRIPYRGEIVPKEYGKPFRPSLKEALANRRLTIAVIIVSSCFILVMLFLAFESHDTTSSYVLVILLFFAVIFGLAIRDARKIRAISQKDGDEEYVEHKN